MKRYHRQYDACLPRKEVNDMGVVKYQARGKTFWKVDESITMPDGTEVRIQRS